MLTIPGNARLFFYQEPVSMHKSFEGLGFEIEQCFPGQLMTGAFFIFLNRGRNCMKVLFWDVDGFVIFYKRLEKGAFVWKWNDQKHLDRRTFLMLLEGVEPKRLRKRFSL